MTYINPVPGFIHPIGWARPAGNIEFKVTSLFGPRSIRMPDGSIRTDVHDGVDIGNGRCDGKVLAYAAGKVVKLDKTQGIVGIDVGGGHQHHYAHMFPVLVTMGQQVAFQQQIGEVGDASAVGTIACHLHFVHKVNGVSVDPLPLLNKVAVSGDNMDPSLVVIPNRTVVVNAGARHRTAPTLDASNIAIASDPGGRLAFPILGTVKGTAANGSDLWYVYWHDTVNKWYYLHSTVCSTPVPWEQSVSDCAPAVSAAVAPLQAKITTLETQIKSLETTVAGMKTKTAAFSADIAND